MLTPLGAVAIVGRANSNREKSNIAILEKLPFLKGNKNYFAFDGSNNIFADCSSSILIPN